MPDEQLAGPVENVIARSKRVCIAELLWENVECRLYVVDLVRVSYFLRLSIRVRGAAKPRVRESAQNALMQMTISRYHIKVLSFVFLAVIDFFASCIALV